MSWVQRLICDGCENTLFNFYIIYHNKHFCDNNCKEDYIKDHICKSCNGTGIDDSKFYNVDCRNCEGKGFND